MIYYNETQESVPLTPVPPSQSSFTFCLLYIVRLPKSYHLMKRILQLEINYNILSYSPAHYK